MLDLGTLQAHLRLDGADKFNDDLKKAEDTSDKVGKSLQQNLMQAALKVGAGFASLVSAAKDLGQRLKGLADDTAAYGDQVDKNSQKMGISAQEYQKWNYVLERNGSSIDVMQKGLKTLSSKLVEGSQAFEELGVSTTNADGSFRSTEDVLNDTMAALAGMQDATQRNAIATQLFGGKVAQELQPTLNSGADGIEELKNRADELGLVMSDEGVAASAQYKDAMTDLDETISGIKNSIGSSLLPVVTDLVRMVTDQAIPAIKDFTDQNEWLAPVIAGLVTGLIAFKAALGISAIVSGVSQAITAFKAANEGATVAQWLLNAAMQANPIVLIITLITALVGAIVFLWNTNQGFRENVTSVFGTVRSVISNVISNAIQWFNDFKDKIISAKDSVVTSVQSIVENIRSRFEAIRSSIDRVVGWFRGLPNKILSALGGLGSLLWNAGNNIIQGLLDGINAKWQSVKEKVSGMGKWIADHKGPKEYDLKLLVPNGGWIMQGLMQGLQNAKPELQNTLNDIAETVSGTRFNASASLAYATAGPPQNNANAIRQGNNYNVYINGAKINDDKQIENKFNQLLTVMARKGLM